MQTDKGIASDIDASSIVWTFTNNGKLANQMARLVATVVKSSIDQIMNKGLVARELPCLLIRLTENEVLKTITRGLCSLVDLI